MGKEANRQKYIHNYARTLQGKLRVSALRYNLQPNRHQVAQHLYSYNGVYDGVLGHLSQESDEVLGKLACAGLGKDQPVPNESVRLHQVQNHDGIFRKKPKWYSLEESGRMLVLYIASNAVIAAMADNIWAENQEARERRQSA